jgi:hypothetical protein
MAIGVSMSLQGTSSPTQRCDTALFTAAVAQFVWGATDDLTQLALWLPIGVVCLASTWLLLRARLR